MNRTENTPISTDRVRSEKEQIAFFDSCLEGFKKAVFNTNRKDFYYKIADNNIKISFAGDSLIKYLTPAIEHLRVESFMNSDLELCVWDSDSTFTEPPVRPCALNDFTDRGDIWGFNSKRIKTAFHWSEYSINLLDHKTNTAIYWITNDKYMPFWIYASPFRTIFHWFMEKKGCQLLHAASVGTEEGAVLITGKGGVGKSTTALSCLNYGFLYLADDYLITKLDPQPTVFSLYNSAKLNSDNIYNFPEFKHLIDNTDKLDKEKAIMFLYPDLKEKIAYKLPIKAIFTPKITEENETKISFAEKLLVDRSISFTTMSQLPNVGRHTHDFINNLTSRLPSFTLELGKKLDNVPKTIEDFLKNPSQYVYPAENKHRVIKTFSKKPLVTVIIPVFNGEKFISEAIENIILQHYPATEIIIIDDGSTDKSKEIIDNLPQDVRFLNNIENFGPSFSRNRGIRDASGEFITFLDVDDLWPENNLNLLLNEMIINPNLDVIHGYAQVIKYNPNTDDYEYVGGPKDSFRHYIGAGIYKKSVFNKVGLFTEILRFGEDEDWYRRAYESNTNIKRIDDTTLFVRRHDKNMTKNKNLAELNTLKVLKMSIDRKREKDFI
ncbi:MAG: glycosyltransferase [Thermodesulfobacteriota bacterium]